MSLFLTPEELVELTGYRRRSSQMQALRYMGIEFRQRPDATIVVLRQHVEQILGSAPKAKHEPKRVEPNWAALEAWNNPPPRRKKKK